MRLRLQSSTSELLLPLSSYIPIRTTCCSIIIIMMILLVVSSSTSVLYRRMVPHSCSWGTTTTTTATAIIATTKIMTCRRRHHHHRRHYYYSNTAILQDVSLSSNHYHFFFFCTTLFVGAHSVVALPQRYHSSFLQFPRLSPNNNKQNMHYSYYSKSSSSFLIMWGEQNEEGKKKKQIQIPTKQSFGGTELSSNTSNFVSSSRGTTKGSDNSSGSSDDSSSGSSSPQVVRPARRGGRNAATTTTTTTINTAVDTPTIRAKENSSSDDGGSWYEQDDDNAYDYNRQKWQQQRSEQRKEPKMKIRRGNEFNSSSRGWYDDENNDATDTKDSFQRGSGGGNGGRKVKNRLDDDGFQGGGGGGGGGGRFRGDGSGRRRLDDREGGGREREGKRNVDNRRSDRDKKFIDRSSPGKGRGRFREYYGGGIPRSMLSEQANSSSLGTSSSSSSMFGKINLKAIENAGYEHLYGIAPVLNALKAKVRNLSIRDNVDDTNRERLLELMNGFDVNDDDEDDDNKDYVTSKPENMITSIKPEAALSPYLFVQEGTLETHNLSNSRSSSNNSRRRSGRSNAKKEAALEIITLARSYNDGIDYEDESEFHRTNHELLPIAEVDKGVLNTLSGNRPHQGFVLRCGGLEFEPVRKLPSPKMKPGNPRLWLALDEVVDPQNLGSLLRSAYFLGNGAGIITDESYPTNLPGESIRGQVGILVCSKNSSPLTPTVSAASAGALEFMTIYSTTNLPKLLNTAKVDGWRILGAAAADVNTPMSSINEEDDDDVDDDDDNGKNSWDFMNSGDEQNSMGDDALINRQKISQEQQAQYYKLDAVDTGRPTILVLGSEGRGLRTLVARACTGFVSIPGGGGGDGGVSDRVGDEVGDMTVVSTQSGVDSLNVGVTGGILLWHFLSK